MSVASASSFPKNGPKPFPERLARGIALALLSFFLLYVRVLAGVLKLGIAAVKNTRRVGPADR